MNRRWLLASTIVALVVVPLIYLYATTQPYTAGQPVSNSGCHQEKSNGLYVRAVQDSSGVPIDGVEVKASPATLCNGVETVTAILLQAATNSSGLVHFEGFYGTHYELTIMYSGKTYNYTAAIKANEITFLTVHFPSGSFETNYQSSAVSTITVTAGSNGPPLGCVSAKQISNQGYSLEIYLSPAPRVGDNVCLYVVFKNVNGSSSALPSVAITITNASGKVAFQSGCVTIGPTATTARLGVGQASTCLAYWNTSTGYKGIIPQPGTYQVQVSVQSLSAEVNLKLSN